jgi:hypothetical protein
VGATSDPDTHEILLSAAAGTINGNQSLRLLFESQTQSHLSASSNVNAVAC